MGFGSMNDVGNALTVTGATLTSTFRKVPSQASTANWWVDISMAPGNPSPNYYVGDVQTASVFNRWKSIFHGDNVTPKQMILTHLALNTPTAGLVGQYKLLDYLLFYPFVDLDDTGTQTMDNTIVTALPRYANGEGVLPMVVCTAPTAGGGSFTFDYYNQNGVQHTSPTNYYSVSASTIAQIVTSEPAQANVGPGPFLRLAEGDTGVRQILTWNNIVSNGGLGSVVLVKELASVAIREITTVNERCFIEHLNQAPIIYDGAFLNFIMRCSATVAAGLLHGYATFAWN
jgi:hypothetical protein